MSTGVKWIAVTIAAVAVGEAVALFFGTLPRGGERDPWATPAHRLYLALDVVSGGAIIWLVLTAQAGRALGPLWGWLTLFTLTHVARFAEYLRGRPNPFCANRQLFLVNNIKLVAVLVVQLGIIIR